jgi:hypothetical protein
MINAKALACMVTGSNPIFVKNICAFLSLLHLVIRPALGFCHRPCPGVTFNTCGLSEVITRNNAWTSSRVIVRNAEKFQQM